MESGKQNETFEYNVRLLLRLAKARKEERAKVSQIQDELVLNARPFYGSIESLLNHSEKIEANAELLQVASETLQKIIEDYKQVHDQITNTIPYVDVFVRVKDHWVRKMRATGASIKKSKFLIHIQPYVKGQNPVKDINIGETY